MIILMFIPCYQFLTVDGMTKAVSLSTLMNNFWDMARERLFGADTQQQEQIVEFAKYMLALIPSFIALFAIGVAASVYSAVSAFAYFGGSKTTRARALFITLVPNRVMLCIYQALLLPIFFFPMLLPPIYDGVLLIPVQLVCTPFDMMFVALVLYALTVAVSVLTARYETIEEMNVFYKPRPLKTMSDAEQEVENIEDDEELDEYEKMNKRAREEQTERILRLLSKTDDNDNKDEEDK